MVTLPADAGIPRRLQHRRLRIERQHMPAARREGARQRRRPAAEVEHVVARPKARKLGDPLDQPIRSGRRPAR
jgi:hypothetical protein